MKPVKITMANFGPYVHETVDFNKFTDVPLFLISGNTGAGKTTIFDAMSYALFDVTSGGDRKATSMLSDFAKPGDQMMVTFVFDHQHRRYQIKRSPAHLAPKKRGEGFRNVPAEVELTVYEGDKEIAQYIKKNQADPYIRDLLHLNASQFAQIVLLPQGQFRQFLAAPSDEKEALLTDLFGTALYSEIVQVLKQQLKAQEATNHAVQAELLHDQSALKWVGDNEANASQLGINDVVALAKQQGDELTEQVAQQQAAVKAAEVARDTAQKQLDNATRLNQLLVDQTTVQTALADLIAEQPAIDQLRDDVAEMTALQAKQVIQNKLNDDQTRLDQMTGQLAQLHDEAKEAQAALVTAQTQQKDLTKQQAGYDARATELAQLTPKRPLFEQLADAATHLTTLTEQKDGLDEQVTTANTQIETLTEQLNALQTQVAQESELLKRANALASDQTKLQALNRQAMSVAEVDEALSMLQTDLAAAQTQAKQAEAELTKAQTDYDAINQQWLQHQIANLTSQLKPGTPCPVCGSTTHPHPANVAVMEVTEADVEAAQAAFQSATTTAEAARAQVKSLQTQIDQQTDNLADQRQNFETALTAQLINPIAADLAEQQTQLTVALTTVDMAIKENQQALTALETAKTQLTELTSQQMSEQQQLDELTVQLKTVMEKALAAKLSVENLAQQLPTELASLKAFDEHVAELKAAQTEFDAQKKAAETAVATANQTLSAKQSAQVLLEQQRTDLNVLLENDQAQWQAALKELWPEQSFDDAMVRVEQLTKRLSTLTEDRQRITTFDQQLSVKTAERDQLAKQIGDQQPVATDELMTTLTNKRETVNTLQKVQFETQALIDDNAKLIVQIETTMKQQQAAQDAYNDLYELTNTMNGNNDSHLTLERYVLRSVLQQVLTVANERMLTLTNGRYQFTLEQNAGSYKKSTGLEINVFDDNVGKERSVHTLSGGESFIAALALALGLGEVIQQTAGGITVEALFVDEGFGSLDEEALQTALEALETIDGDSRMIGIISHVKELKEQIPSQIQVMSEGNGRSKIRYQLEFSGAVGVD